MNAAAKAVMKDLPDLVLAYGNSDEYRSVLFTLQDHSIYLIFEAQCHFHPIRPQIIVPHIFSKNRKLIMATVSFFTNHLLYSSDALGTTLYPDAIKLAETLFHLNSDLCS